MANDSFTLDGKEYTFRRLGLSDVFTIQELATSIVGGATIKGIDLSFDDGASVAEQLVAFLCAGMSFAKDEIMKFILSLPVDSDGKVFTGQDIYLADLVGMMNALMEQYDIKSFLGQAKELLNYAKNLTAAQAPLSNIQ